MKQFRLAIAAATMLATAGLTAYPAPLQAQQTGEKKVRALLDAGQPSAALPIARRQLAAAEKRYGKRDKAYATAALILGDVYDELGISAAAEDFYRQALAIREKAFGLTHSRTVYALRRLANILYSQSKYKGAESIHRRTLAIHKKRLGPNHINVANNLHNLANAVGGQGRHDAAIRLYRQSLKIQVKARGRNDPKNALTMTVLANAIVRKMRQTDGDFNAALEEARQLTSRALEITETSFGKDHPKTAYHHQRLGAVYRWLGNFELEVAHKTQALSITEKTYGADHSKLARALFVAGDSQVVQNKPQAYVHFRRAVAIHERNKAYRTHAGDRAGGGLGARPSRLLFRLIEVAYDIREELPDLEDEINAEAFAAAQRILETSTSVALAQMSARFASGTSELAKRIRERQDLVKDWRRLDGALLQAISKPLAKRSNKEIEQLRRKVKEHERSIATVTAHLKKNFPEYGELSEPAPLSLPDVQELLRPDEVLLLVLPGSQTADIWAVTRDAAQWRRSKVTRDYITARVNALRESLDPASLETADADVFDLDVAYSLYADLIRPVEDMIGDKRKILFVSRGALTALPLQVLVTEKPPVGRPADISGYRDAGWLIKRHAVVTLPSVSSLRALRVFAKKGTARLPFIGYGDPVFGKGKRTRGKTRATRTAQSKTRSFGTYFTHEGLVDTDFLGVSLPPLPDTADELRRVADRLGAPQSQVRLGKSATERNVKQARLDKYRVVYFATHGLVAGEVAKLGGKSAEPALALTIPKTASTTDNGLLTASEVAQLKLNADWVILSACNTAAGDKPGAEALSGLSKAFIYAGARSLLVSHWPVKSGAAVSLTTGMFKAKAEDTAIDNAEALRRSVLALQADDSDFTNAYPAIWAPFVVVGD